MVKCRSCREYKWRGDICPTAHCTSRPEQSGTLRKGNKSRFAITAMYSHGFHEELALGRRS